MEPLIREAMRYLPNHLREGSIVKIPVNRYTGKFVVNAIVENNPNIIFHGFVRKHNKWVFIGRGLTAS